MTIDFVYYDLVRDLLDFYALDDWVKVHWGNCYSIKQDRTGVGTVSCFHKSYCIDVSADAFPILTTKKVNFRAIVAELIWFLSGDRHIRNLQKYTKIWDEWADEDGCLDFAYPRYWRNYPMPDTEDVYSYNLTESLYENETIAGFAHPYVKYDTSTSKWVFDQFAAVLDELKRNKYSRRLVISPWYPPNALVAKLPPCHHDFVFNAQGDYLHLNLTQRSNDLMLGTPFNISSYCLLLLLVAREVGLKPGCFAHTQVDSHIYLNHIEGAVQQLTRTPYKLPSITLPDAPLLDLTWDHIDDFKLNNYQHHPAIHFPVAV